MSSVTHAKLIREILDEKHITSLSGVTDECQLEVYTLTLSKIRDPIERYSLANLPHQTILDGLEAIDEMSRALVPISLRETEEPLLIKDTILPLIENALLAARQVEKIYEREKKKAKKADVQKEDLPPEYDQYVMLFRRRIIEIHEQLREK